MLKRLTKPAPDLFWDWLYLAGIATLGTALIADSAPDCLTPAMWAGVGACGWGWLARRLQGQHFDGRRNMRQMSHTATSLRMLRPESGDGPPEYLYKFKHKPLEPEYIFRPGERRELHIPVEIYESGMLRFLIKAKRRQVYALYDGPIVWTGRANHRKVKINSVLSEKEYTKRTTPRFPEAEFFGMMIILGAVGVIVLGSRGQGKSGYLRGDFAPAQYLEIAIRRWSSLTAPRPGPLAQSRWFRTSGS